MERRGRRSLQCSIDICLVIPRAHTVRPYRLYIYPLQSKPASDLKLIALQEVSERSKRIVIAVKLASACQRAKAE